MNAKLEGDKRLERALREMKGEARKHLPAALKTGANIIVNEAKRKCPVLTGNLRRSIHFEIESKDSFMMGVKIGTNLEYAPSVEYGTRPHRKAQPFLRPSFDEKKQSAQNEIVKAIDILIRKFGR